MLTSIERIVKSIQISDTGIVPGGGVGNRQEELSQKTLGIPVIGLVDTKCNPEDVDYVIPGNDDAIRAIKLIVEAMANAVIESKQGETPVRAEESEEMVQE